jgi:hypothetical protein
MAGQRGAGQNVGLIARQAAQQGASTQQQAAGQAATMQAQQQIAYQQALGQQAGTMVGQQSGATNAQAQNAIQQQLGLTGTAAGLQQNVNTTNAGLAQTQMQGQQGLLGGLGNSIGPVASGIGSMLAAAEGGQVKRYAGGTPIGGIPQAGSYDQNFQGLTDAQWNAGNTNPSTPPPAPAQTPPATVAPPTTNSPSSSFAKFLKGGQQSPTGTQPNYGNPGANALYSGMSSLGKSIGSGLQSLATSSQDQNLPGIDRGSNDPTAQYMGANAELGSGGDTEEEVPAANTDVITPNTEGEITAFTGGKVKALVSPGEVYLKPNEVQKALRDGKPLKHGEKIPGKPKVKGAVNSYANDTVKKNLDEGGIVIPRSITQGPNPHWNAMLFVHKTLKGKK